MIILLYLNMNHLRGLLAIIIGFIGFSLLYNLSIPPFEGPDGPEHFAYITWLAEGSGFPPQGEAAWQTPVRQEASQPPLYYLLAAIPANLININNPAAIYRPNPHFPSSAPGNVPDNKNIAIHYEADTRPLRGGWLALYLARIISLSFGVLLILSVYGLARQLLPQHPHLALAATAFTAFTPQVIFLSSVVSNDMAATAVSTFILWLVARTVRQGLTPRSGFFLGASYGLAALTKSSTLALAIPILAVFVYFWLSGRYHLKHLLKSGLWLTLAVLLIAGWWYFRSWRLYGSLLGLETHCYAPWALCQDNSQRANALQQWREVYDSYWAAFGWGNIKFAGWLYNLWSVFPITGIVGLVRAIRKWRRSRDVLDRDAVVMLSIFTLTLFIFSISLESWMRQVTAPHGRLLFPAISCVTLLLLVGWHTLWPRLTWISIGGVLLLTIVSWFYLIRPAYARPSLTADLPETVTNATPIGWQFGQIATFHSISPERPSAIAGETLPIDLCWRTLARADQDYSILLHIIGPNNQVVASRHTYPGLGSYPTRDWQPDHLFCDTIRVDIPSDLNQTLLYQIEVGWLDMITMNRLPAVGPKGETLDQTFPGAIRLQSAKTQWLDTFPPGDGSIRLVDHWLSSKSWQPGTIQEFILEWALADPVTDGYTTFVHLRDPISGQNIAQADGPPLGGWYPTSAWKINEVVRDDRQFSLPADISQGNYDLVVGWYLPTTEERLGNEFLLGTIEVISP